MSVTWYLKYRYHFQEVAKTNDLRRLRIMFEVASNQKRIINTQ